MTDRIRLLVIEDNPGDARLVREALSEVRRPTFDVESADRLRRGIDRLQAGDVDVVLLDLGLPDASGLDGLRALRESVPMVPVVVLTISDDETLVWGAVAAGAQDYVVKGHLDPDVLARTLRYAIERQRLLDAEHAAAARLRELDKIKNDFIGIVSHELRSPLTVMTGFLRIMLDDPGSLGAEERRHLLARTLSNAEEMAMFIEDILDVTKIESGSLRLEMAPFRLVELIREVGSEMAAGADHVFAVDAPDGCPQALGDERRQRQIITNLLSNAFKFSSPGSKVDVSVACGAAMFEVRVRDHGMGIAREDTPKLFKKFSRIQVSDGEHRAGTGLGLYICKCFVEAQGGTIGVESHPGEGSIFTYTVLRADQSDG